MSLRTSLEKKPSDILRRKIVCHFWRKDASAINIRSYDNYFQYYNTTCQALSLGVANTELDSLSIKMHEDLLDMIDTLWELSRTTPKFDRPLLRAALKELPIHNDQPPDKINNSINFLLRLWLTIRIQESSFSPAARSVQWNDVTNIRDFVACNFSAPRSNNIESTSLLESDFTAVNLFRMCGIRVNWTYQLEDHLQYDIANREVSIYALCECLQGHLDWYVKIE